MNTEDSVKNTTINITKAEGTAVKVIKEETEEKDDPLLLVPGQLFLAQKPLKVIKKFIFLDLGK